MDDRALKKDFKKKASQNYQKYYAVDTLKSLGFTRKQCKKCGTYFWSVKDRDICGDPECEGGYSFIENSPAKKKLDFIQVWKEMSSLFEKKGYAIIKRYPVVARWRDDTDFVQASIYDFQPHVVKGVQEPPANPLLVPQFCVRFNDIDNVGVTLRHYTGFVMIGQHAFFPPKEFSQDRFLSDIYDWLKTGLGITSEELIFHEDAWAGGGNFGPCMEFFSRGLELGNQVYIEYEVTPSGGKELDLKVLDMGAGQERFSWFSLANPIGYETVFPTVCDHLYRRTGITPNKSFLKGFIPYSGMLNMDEVEDIEKVWDSIAKKLSTDKEYLKQQVLPLQAIYSIGDHSRSLLFALSDGALPSNVGGGYNLRVILRRALSFIERFSWDIELQKVIEEHAKYLKPQYPELKENISDICEIISYEMEKFENTKDKSRRIIERLNEKGEELSEDKLIELYDSHGITPEVMGVKLPKDFYKRVTERHEKKDSLASEKEIHYDMPDTERLYYDGITEFSAKVLDVSDNIVILDKTAFYPESGGQEGDRGLLNDCPVTYTKVSGNVILHIMEKINFKKGDTVKGLVDKDRRLNLTRHHTATHIINGVSRQILGNHIWQAGAEKTEEKARLDITHYKLIDNEDLFKIEKISNEIVLKNLPIEKGFFSRAEAEKKYGFRLYQGGAVPGKKIRVVNVKGLDVEACGGTHLDSTGQIGPIKILKQSKIQDGVVRLEFCAGLKALDAIQEESILLRDLSDVFKVEKDKLLDTGKRFFNEWKNRGKEIERLKAEMSCLKKEGLECNFIESDGVLFMEETVNTSPDEMRKIAKDLSGDNKVIVLTNNEGNIVVSCGKIAIESGHKACNVIKKYGKGGGRDDFAQGVKG